RDAVLLVSELVSNAILHGRPPIELRLRRAARDLLVEVDDGATVLPRKLRPTPDDEHGRGLVIASLLADRWGTRPLRDGKSVW
ncbi:ATP-binding protein, partial [Salmonella enterica]|uniref:ATP-binding protein n=1 Tax=Salmonella enterica TaxID=28901 RepID=UPI0015C9162D